MKKRFWEFKNAINDTGELYIYGDIVSYQWDDSDTTAQSFKDDLKALGDIKTLNVYINSPGGSVFQGQAIHTILKRHNAHVNVHVDGVAASIASVIAMAGDTVYMPKNAMMMIHNPWTFAMGNAQELRKQADALDKIGESIIEAYLSKTGDRMSREQLAEIMDAETWLSAQECFDYGLCDEIVEAQEIVASANTELLSRFKNVPETLKNALKKPENELIGEEERQKMIAESKGNIEKINKILGGM
ncbi:head maturation protease, ClpP-related [Aneurinibacillus sp. REN35]|uniref:head maturation protease, ClpP-related n=1 Tax=Aneurinibacillus sp. REN35 TaxID=3237286 RepID=UPI003527C759